MYCTAHRGRGLKSRSTDQDTYIDALRHRYPDMVLALGSYVSRVKTGVLVEINSPSRRVASPGADQLPRWLPAREIQHPRRASELLVSIDAFEEKGSDVNVATHFMLDVLSGEVDAAIVLSNDSDLRLPIQQARQRVHVGTVNPTKSPTSYHLQGDAQEGAGQHWWRRLGRSDFTGHQLPKPTGSLDCPQGW